MKTYPRYSLDIVNVNPDTLRTLDTARINANQEININGSGFGFLVLNDADRNVVTILNKFYNTRVKL